MSEPTTKVSPVNLDDPPTSFDEALQFVADLADNYAVCEPGCADCDLLRDLVRVIQQVRGDKAYA